MNERTVIETLQLPASDGRNLDVYVGGAERGTALLCHHGTPSDGTLWAAWNDLAVAYGLRLIAIARPGYAVSTRKPERTIGDVAADAAAVLDALDIGTFVTAGWSGGGPHALACAALLPGRCRAAAIVAGVAPYDAAGLDFYAGMEKMGQAEFRAAATSETALRAEIGPNAELLRGLDRRRFLESFGGAASAEATAAERLAGPLTASLRRSMAWNFDGWVDDARASTVPWGFDVRSIGVPVSVWHGDLDGMVPVTHGTWVAGHVPHARAYIVPGLSHFSILILHEREIVEDLLARAKA